MEFYLEIYYHLDTRSSVFLGQPRLYEFIRQYFLTVALVSMLLGWATSSFPNSALCAKTVSSNGALQAFFVFKCTCPPTQTLYSMIQSLPIVRYKPKLRLKFQQTPLLEHYVSMIIISMKRGAKCSLGYILQHVPILHRIVSFLLPLAMCLSLLHPPPHMCPRHAHAAARVPAPVLLLLLGAHRCSFVLNQASA